MCVPAESADSLVFALSEELQLLVHAVECLLSPTPVSAADRAVFHERLLSARDVIERYRVWINGDD